MNVIDIRTRRSRGAQKEDNAVELVMKARQGDGEAFAEVWTRALTFLRRPMLNFLAYLPRTFSSGRRRVELDDLMQEGLLGAWRACLDFDPARGKALVHVAFRARSAMQAYLRRQVTLRRLQAEDPANARSANDLFTFEVAPSALPEAYSDIHDGERRAA